MQSNRGVSNLEVRFRKALWAAGLRGYRTKTRLPGRPDVVFPGRRTAIFVHGCFWHSCPKGHLPAPKANASFWRAKFRENRKRDEASVARLTADGWAVLTIWECDLRSNFSDAVEQVRAALATGNPPN
jgi:DNA mismatch endonuclease (patch repair protein)